MTTNKNKNRKNVARKARPKHLYDVDAVDKQQKNPVRMINTMAALSDHATCLNRDLQKSLLNRYYKWEMVIPLDDGILAASHLGMRIDAQFSYRLYLHAEAAKTDWVQWLEIKSSNLAGAGLGVFSLREFTKGQVIGWFYGKKRAVRQGTDSTSYQLADNDAEGSIGYQGGLGMHVINDPSMFSEGADRKKKTKLWNVLFLSDYSVMAKRTIRIGEELYADYNRSVDK